MVPDWHSLRPKAVASCSMTEGVGALQFSARSMTSSRNWDGWQAGQAPLPVVMAEGAG
jgi:hypothetical protein